MNHTNANLTTMNALRSVVLALERRFPNHNGPFEYGTRLAEEVGELTEALYIVEREPNSPEEMDHLAKEQQDVLRVIVGISMLYKQTDSLPASIDAFVSDITTQNNADLIAQLSINCGRLTSAINHAQGMGVKNEKHGNSAHERIAQRAAALAGVVAATIQHHKTATMVNERIINAYNDYKKQGFID